MKTEKTNPALADLFKQLQSENTVLAHKALKKLTRQSGINEMPLLIRIMGSTKDGKIRQEIETWLANIKSKNAPAVFAKALADPESAGIRVPLVRACWESQLDFSPHLMLFAHLFIAGDFELAIEAFSVIENTRLEHPVTAGHVGDIITQLKNSLPDQPETKQRLVREMIRVLEPFDSQG
jgi:hypothetical protein